MQQMKGWDAAPGIRAAPHGLAVNGDVARRTCGDTPGQVDEHRFETGTACWSIDYSTSRPAPHGK